MLIMPVWTRTAMVRATLAVAACDAIMSLRRSRRSAMAPPTSENRSIGMPQARVMRAMEPAEWLSL